MSTTVLRSRAAPSLKYLPIIFKHTVKHCTLSSDEHEANNLWTRCNCFNVFKLYLTRSGETTIIPPPVPLVPLLLGPLLLLLPARPKPALWNVFNISIILDSKNCCPFWFGFLFVRGFPIKNCQCCNKHPLNKRNLTSITSSKPLVPN